MFLVECHQHGAPVLLGPRSIRALTNTPDGIVLEWTCHCGATGAQRYGAEVARPAEPEVQQRPAEPEVQQSPAEPVAEPQPEHLVA